MTSANHLLPLSLRSCASMLALAAVSVAVAAKAQEAAPAPVAADPAQTASAEEEMITVTGTMFRRARAEAASPVTVLSAESLAKAGINTVADAVRSISADNSGSIPTAFGNGFARGSSGVALRGLSVNSTLVLIDGLRTANYALADDGQKSFVDLNSIPNSLVDRVEVLRDGASSTYGSDAIAGVVNLVLKKEFQGVAGTVEAGTSQKGGGTTYRGDVTVGAGDLSTNGLNAYLNLEYQHDDNIGYSQRGFPFNTADLRSIGGNNTQVGRPGARSGSVYGTVRPGVLGTPGNLLTGQPTGPAQTLRAGGCGPDTLQIVNPGNSVTTGGTFCQQNMVQFGDVQPAQERIGLSGRITAQLTDDIRAYTSLSYYLNKVVSNRAPRQIQGSTPTNTNNIALPVFLNNGQLNPNNPFAAQGQVALINYAFGDIDSSAKSVNHVLRGVIGIEGETGDWSWNVSGVAAHTWLNTGLEGYINAPALLAAINSGAYSFVNPDGNSAAVRASIAPSLSKQSTTDLDMIQASVTRPLAELPGGPLSLGLGGQLRYEAVNDPDLNPNNEVLGLGSAFAKGSHYVSSGFFEIDAPVLTTLEINAAGRYDHYSEGFSHFSPKIGAKFTPIPQLAVRGTFSKGFRAPSFAENGSSSQLGFSTHTPFPAFLDQHGGRTGNTNPYVQAYSLGTNTVANPEVKPELSQSYTFGAVIQPTPWLSLTADYYHIKKTRVISQADPSTALTAYYAGQPLPPGYSLVLDTPDPLFPTAPARPVIVAAPYFNADSLVTDGLDVTALVQADLADNVRFSSELSVTTIFHNRVDSGGNVFDYVGTQSSYNLSSGAGTPRWRGSWQNSISYGPATLTATAYYTSGYKMIGYDATADDSCLSTVSGNPFPANCRTKSFTFVNLQGSYKVSENFELFGTVQNLLNTKPPFNPANYAGVNYNPTWSQQGIVGRFFRLGAHVKF